MATREEIRKGIISKGFILTKEQMARAIKAYRQLFKVSYVVEPLVSPQIKI